MRNFSNKMCTENQNTHFLFSNFYENRAACKIMPKNVVQPEWPQTIWRLRVACTRPRTHIPPHTAKCTKTLIKIKYNIHSLKVIPSWRLLGAHLVVVQITSWNLNPSNWFLHTQLTKTTEDWICKIWRRRTRRCERRSLNWDATSRQVGFDPSCVTIM
jgi:hypothetical protein